MNRVSQWISVVALGATLWATRVEAQATTANPHEASIGACSRCHLPNAWRPVRIGADYRHAEKTFPLDGAHTTAKCTTCHTSLQFSKAPAQCASCHKDVHRAELGVNCAKCHTTRAFDDQTRLARMHEETRFPLRGAHTATSCVSCHPATAAGQAQFTGRPTTCVGCHRPDYDKTTSPSHTAAVFSTTCTSCHTSNTTWKAANFNHSTTQFPLAGAHLSATCASCHSDGVFKGKATTCVSCHRPDYDLVTNSPPHAAAGFSTTCTSCHSSNTSWKGAAFNHSTTQFPLTGAHQAATCASCHADKVFKGKLTTCVSCHRPDYDRATNSPPHASAGFSTTCTNCHTSRTTWQGASFNHSTTQFPLAGAHLTATCASCHADKVFKGKSTSCVSCHRPDYDRPTNSPPHAAAGFSTTCTTCHTSNTSWKGAAFNHSTTQFPLTGAHLTVACATCHADGVFRGKPTTCISCHRPNYDRTTSPAHAAAGYSTDCTTCHTSRTTWSGASFNHSTTQFPLTGAHLTVSCISCHADGVYRGKPTTCISCHRPDYDRTTTPAHATAGYSTDCTTCHTSRTTWQGATFNHSTTQFPLTGAHLAASCISCHADGVYRGKPTTCISCHRPDYDRPTNTPPHAAAGFSTDCTTCHTSRTTWNGGTFNHSTTQFPLTGAHLTVSCISCHADGIYRGKPTTCISCHRPDYDRTTTPAHAAAGYSTDCTTCHTSRTTWLGATFNHSTTQFPLTGAHLAVSCISCHADGVYRGKPTACVSCHRADYDRPTNTPPHAAAGFSTTCTTCHTSTTTWAGGSFNHSTTLFPLTGRHLTVACASCHSDGVYRGKSTLCSSCHQTDYNATTNPNHVAARFPTTCATCHTTTTWVGARFDHDTPYFPIYSGSHAGRWATCASCHTTPGSYTVYACIACHTQTSTNSHHSGVSNYRYLSTACYSCHPRGRAG